MCQTGQGHGAASAAAQLCGGSPVGSGQERVMRVADLNFAVGAVWEGSGRAGSGTLFLSGHAVRYSAPETMGGRGEGTSPEELLLAAVASCYSGTLHRVIERAGLPSSGWISEPRGWCRTIRARLVSVRLPSIRRLWAATAPGARNIWRRPRRPGISASSGAPCATISTTGWGRSMSSRHEGPARCGSRPAMAWQTF